MDVRGVLRRLRLPLVASLFLALAGGPGAVTAIAEPLPAPAVVVSAASATVAEVAEAVALSERLDAVRVALVFVLAVFFLLTVPAARSAAAVLAGRSRAGAVAPRAPPIAV